MQVIKRVACLIPFLLSGCNAREPQTQTDAPGPRVVAVGSNEPIRESPPLAVILQGPTFTRFTQAPELLNGDEVRRVLEREYPARLKETGTTGTTRIWFLLDVEGRILSRVIDQSSGIADLDAAALRVAQVFRFSGALDRGIPVYVWVSVPIQFGPGK